MNHETVAELVRLAMLAPTPDNSQPWLFEWDGEALQIRCDSKRVFATDPTCVHYRLCLGMLQEGLELACSALGFRPDFELNSSAEPGEVWLSVRFSKTSSQRSPLVDAMEMRVSDRRMFAGGSLSAPVFSDMVNDASRFRQSNLYLRPKVDGPFREWYHGAIPTFFYWREFQGDMIRWWRLSEREVQSSRDGMSSVNIGAPSWQLRIVRMLHRVPGGFNFLKRFGGGPVPRFDDGAGLGLVTVTDHTADAMVDAGRLSYRGWLQLAQAGYSYRPEGLLILVYSHALGTLAPSMPERFRESARVGADIIRRTFGVPDGEIPIWLFRTGLPRSPLPNGQRTLRRHVEQCLTIVE